MSFLARFRVLTKIVAVVVLLSAVAIGITFLGITSLNQIANKPIWWQRLEMKLCCSRASTQMCWQ